MLIEFTCPVCQAALAIKKQAIGGQVNCPKCQKLILLPSESPLPRRNADTPPYQSGQEYPVKDITKAICVSVEPYRRDLETKTELLNDAVEMVKVRNERIKEIETFLLNTQSELWALEVEYEELQSGGGPEFQELEKEKRELELKKDKLKARLTNMVDHSEHLDRSVREYQELLAAEGPVHLELEAVTGMLEARISALADGAQVSGEAAELLRTTTEKITTCHAHMQESNQRRREMEELVRASSEDMQRAIDERNQWRKRGQELEKQVKELGEAGEAMRIRLAEAEKLQAEWTQDRESAKHLRLEMEENLELLRKRIEEEREDHRNTLAEREAKLSAAAEKKLQTVERKWKQAAEELAESEAKRLEALKTQQQLAEQNMKAEEERSELRKRLGEAMDRLEQLDGPA